MSGIAVVRRGFAHEGTGPLPYMPMWQEQRELHEAVAGRTHPGAVLLLEHEPVFTAGRRTNEADRPLPGTAEARGAAIVDVDRGGSITWHGPGQIVGYPILALPQAVFVVDFVRRLEEVVIRTCADLGVSTVPVTGRSGVWVPADPERHLPERKICAIGIRVARGVTMHGFALNVDPDLSWFGLMVPCGISDAGVTSLSRELGRTVTLDEVLDVLEPRLHEQFDPWSRAVGGSADGSTGSSTEGSPAASARSAAT
jgi:lipoyl(octanoyl) transferase